MSSKPSPSYFPTFLIPSLPFRRRLSSQGSNTSTTSTASTSSTSSAPPGEYLSGSTSHLRCGRCASDLCLTTQIISKGFTGRYGRAYLVSPSIPYSYSYTSNILPHSTSSDAHDLGGTLPNIHTHKPVPRQLVTGAHVVSDISCASCGSVLGWKYVGAEEESQRYKVGKFILETKRVRGSVCWDNEIDDAEVETMNRTAATRQRSSCTAPTIDRGGLMWRFGGGAPGFHNHDYGDDEEGDMPPDRIDQPQDIEFDSQDEDECEDLFAGVWNPTLASKRRRNKLFGRD